MSDELPPYCTFKALHVGARFRFGAGIYGERPREEVFRKISPRRYTTAEGKTYTTGAGTRVHPVAEKEL